MQRSWGRENCNVWEEKSWCRWSPVVETRDKGPEGVINTASLHGRRPRTCVLVSAHGGPFLGAEDAHHVLLFRHLRLVQWLLGHHSDVIYSYSAARGNQIPLCSLVCCFQKRTSLSRFYGLSTTDEKDECPGIRVFPVCGPELSRGGLAVLHRGRLLLPPPAYLLRGAHSFCDVLLLGPAGLPPGRGTPCCSTMGASTRSTTSSPWRSWASRCSSPSQQVGPPSPQGAAP